MTNAERQARWRARRAARIEELEEEIARLRRAGDGGDGGVTRSFLTALAKLAHEDTHGSISKATKDEVMREVADLLTRRRKSRR